MKKTLPQREVELCDCCHRENNYLDTCKFCGGRYCLLCRATISGCVHHVDVCRNCQDNPILLAIVEKYAPLINAVLEARDIEIGEAFQQMCEPDVMPCGHPLAESYLGEDGCAYCRICESA